MKHVTLGVIACLVAAPATAQTHSTVAAIEAAVPVNIYGQPMQGKLMPASTMVNVTPLEEISSNISKSGRPSASLPSATSSKTAPSSFRAARR